MIEPKIKPTVELTGTDGNAFVILGRVKKTLLKAGADKEYASKYIEEAMAGDYNNLLAVTMDYVDIA